MIFNFKVAEQELENKSKLLASADQAAKLDARLSSSLTLTSCDTEASEARAGVEAVVSSIISDILCDVVHQTGDQADGGPGCSVEIDCTGPDITVQALEQGDSPSRPRHRHRLRVVEGEAGQVRQKHKSRRKGAKKYPRTGKDARARFKSSEDLIHRLYVCISGAADQLQTNFAGDFRSILKYVFVMNSSQEEEEEEDVPETDEKSQESLSLSEADEELSGDPASPDEVSLEADSERGEASSVMIPATRGSQNPYECGEDALMNETEQSYLRSLPAQSSLSPGLLSTSPPAGLAAMPVYASNLDYHLGEAGILGTTEPGQGGEGRFYQPEPTLLTIASGEEAGRLEVEQERTRPNTIETPPTWIPDSMAPLCMGCGVTFSLVRRRHHCRSCGRVFCAKCSPNQVSVQSITFQLHDCNVCRFLYRGTGSSGQ